MRLKSLFAATAATVLALLAATAPALADTRSLTDDAGRSVAVPARPARIVVMHEPLLGLPLMDLGVEVVGSYGRGENGKFVTAIDFVDLVLGSGRSKPRGIGPVGQIDLERLRALGPDLIVGTELDVDKAPQLATVAPVYLQKVSTGKIYGFGVEKDLARVVGREDSFAAREAAYRERVAAVRRALPSDPAGKSYLAIFLTDQVNLVGDMSGAVQALEDLGYRRMAVDQKSAGAALGSTLMVPLSPEVLGRANPDLLVVMNSYTGGGRDEAGTRAALDRIVPGWSRFLKPAREGRVLFLDSAEVTTPTVASALHTLDAVERQTKR